jgi:hypothetical protein
MRFDMAVPQGIGPVTLIESGVAWDLVGEL